MRIICLLPCCSYLIGKMGVWYKMLLCKINNWISHQLEKMMIYPFSFFSYLYIYYCYYYYFVKFLNCYSNVCNLFGTKTSLNLYSRWKYLLGEKRWENDISKCVSRRIFLYVIGVVLIHQYIEKFVQFNFQS